MYDKYNEVATIYHGFRLTRISVLRRQAILQLESESKGRSQSKLASERLSEHRAG